jgi:acyl-CoA reductase-like NAD-dependent aldehyde dehydrogenase
VPLARVCWLTAPFWMRFRKRLRAAAQAQILGDPLDPATTMGALTMARSIDRVLSYIAAGHSQGATLVAGGKQLDRKGYFIEPTIFIGNLRIAREEIFGPVGTLIPFDSHEEAVRIANDTEYWLNAGSSRRTSPMRTFWHKKFARESSGSMGSGCSMRGCLGQA